MQIILKIGIESTTSPVSKLLVPTIRPIVPDDDEVGANNTSKRPKQRGHKSRAGSTRAKSTTGSNPENVCFLQKRFNRELESKKLTYLDSFKHCPLPAPPMFPRLKAGEIVPQFRSET